MRLPQSLGKYELCAKGQYWTAGLNTALSSADKSLLSSNGFIYEEVLIEIIWKCNNLHMQNWEWRYFAQSAKNYSLEYCPLMETVIRNTPLGLSFFLVQEFFLLILLMIINLMPYITLDPKLFWTLQGVFWRKYMFDISLPLLILIFNFKTFILLQRLVLSVSYQCLTILILIMCSCWTSNGLIIWILLIY